MVSVLGIVTGGGNSGLGCESKSMYMVYIYTYTAQIWALEQGRRSPFMRPPQSGLT